MLFSEETRSAAEIRLLVGALHRAVVRNVEEVLAHHQIPLSQLQFGLLMTVKHQAQTISDLSRVFGLDPSTLVPAVDSLVKKGYLERRTDPADRRRAPLLLTDDGNLIIGETLNKFHLLSNDVLAESLTRLGSERQQQLMSILREVVSHLPDGDIILQGMKERIDAYQYIGKEHMDRCFPNADDDHADS